MSGDQSPAFVIIGAGAAGILAGIRLKERGHENFTILERAEFLGGTWRDNKYPGISCDVPAQYYCYSFAPNSQPANRYATGPELLRYFSRIAADYGIERHIRYNSEAASADWDEGQRQWVVTTTAGEQLRADIVIAAVGRLHRARLPDIAGIGDFRGKLCHSSCFDPSVDLSGQRLGLIGSGSSGTQITAAAAGVASHLTLFQRTAQWVLPMPNERVPTWRRLLLRASSRYRMRRYRWVEDQINKLAGWVVSEDSKVADVRRQACLAGLATVRDPALRAKLTPDYEVGCKRLVVSGTFYDAVQRPGVEVITERIERIEADGVRTADGVLHELDVLICATGFHADSYLRPMTLTGEAGITLDDIWADVPMNYKSVALPHMPNFFMINGPFSPGGSASVLAIIEVHVGYVMKLIDRVITEQRPLSPSPERSAELLAGIRQRAMRTVWYTGGCTSWYLDKNGIPLVNPVLISELKADMAEPVFDDYVTLAPVPAGLGRVGPAG
jgi:cation diffusion facilitator CzcD-associated flavoprotein CzcO